MNVGGVRVAHLAWTFGLNGIPPPAGRAWAVNVFDPRVPTVEGMLADAGAARRAGADVVIVSVHCCTEYQTDPPPAQLKIAAALLASPDVDLVIGHHAHVVQPLERINGKWVAYGLGNHVAEQTTQATNDSVITRFTFTRGTGNHFTVTAAEAIPTRIQHTNHGVVVVPTKPGDASQSRRPGAGKARCGQRRPRDRRPVAPGDTVREFTGASRRRRRGCHLPNRTGRRPAYIRQRTCAGRRSKSSPLRDRQARSAAGSA